jgi:hypothetical protein
MSQQIPLIPVSQSECTYAAYELVKLLQMVDDEKESFNETKDAHKETLAALNKGIAAQRATIRRAQEEHAEGITRAQVDALLDQAREQEE